MRFVDPTHSFRKVGGGIFEIADMFGVAAFKSFAYLFKAFQVLIRLCSDVALNNKKVWHVWYARRKQWLTFCSNV